MPLPITVSELRTGNPNVGDNTILIAMRRGDARYISPVNPRPLHRQRTRQKFANEKNMRGTSRPDGRVLTEVVRMAISHCGGALAQTLRKFTSGRIA